MGGLFSSEKPEKNNKSIIVDNFIIEERYKLEFNEQYNGSDNQIIKISSELYCFFSGKNNVQHSQFFEIKLWQLIRVIYIHQRKREDNTDLLLTEELTHKSFDDFFNKTGLDKSAYSSMLLGYFFVINKEIWNNIEKHVEIPKIDDILVPDSLNFEQVSNFDDEDDKKSVGSRESYNTIQSTETVIHQPAIVAKLKSSKKTSGEKLSEAIQKIVSPFRKKVIDNLLSILKNENISEAKKAAVQRVIRALLLASLEENVENQKNTRTVITEELAKIDKSTDNTIEHTILSCILVSDTTEETYKTFSLEEKVKYLCNLAIAFTIKPLNFFPRGDLVTATEESFGSYLKNEALRLITELRQDVLSPQRLAYIEKLKALKDAQDPEIKEKNSRHIAVCALITNSVTHTNSPVDTVVSDALAAFDSNVQTKLINCLETVEENNDALPPQSNLERLIQYALCYRYIIREHPSLVLNEIIKTTDINLIQLSKPYTSSLLEFAEDKKAALNRRELGTIVEGPESQENTPEPVRKRTTIHKNDSHYSLTSVQATLFSDSKNNPPPVANTSDNLNNVNNVTESRLGPV